MPATATYTGKSKCTNCGAKHRHEIDHGNPIGLFDCPNCGCQTLRRSQWLVRRPSIQTRARSTSATHELAV